MAGGEWNKKLRRIGLPVLLVIYIILQQNWLGLVSVPLLALCLSIGYGIPDEEDEGSFLGKLFPNKYIVRTIICIAYAIAFIPWFWGKWVHLSVYFVTIEVITMLAIRYLKRYAKVEQFLIGCGLAIWL